MAITLFHGSQYIIEKPEYGKGNPHNDYGKAFYCTEDIKLAGEWAVTSTQDGYANEYVFHEEGLTKLDLGSGEYNILNWIAILLDNRTFRTKTDFQCDARDYLMKQFLPDYRSYDYICGYRADDSYFSFAGDFINNALSLEKLAEALKLGALGEQYALRSVRAFEQLEYVRNHRADRLQYYPCKRSRDDDARNMFRELRRDRFRGTYILDIIREEWRDGDERIQRIIY